MMCAADETAVALFLERRIGFNDIPRLIEGALAAHLPNNNKGPTLEEVMDADSWARDWVKSKAC